MVRLIEHAGPAVVSAERGYRKPYLQSVPQADEGVDLDFLQGRPPKG